MITRTDIEPFKKGVVVAYMGAPEEAASITTPVLAVEAVKKLTSLMKPQTVDYIVPLETGPMNMAVACLTAAALGIPVVDADGAGRAISSLGLASFTSVGFSVNPTVLTGVKPGGKRPAGEMPGEDGYSHIILNLSEDTGPQAAEKIEAITRPALSFSEYNEMAGLAMWYMNDACILQNQYTCVPGTISLSRDLGMVVAKQQISASPDCQPLLQFLNSQGIESNLICEGTLQSASTAEAGGFDVGAINIAISDKEKVTILFQNESLLLWNSTRSAPLVAAPDTIACFIIDNSPRRQLVFTNGDMMEAAGLKKDLVGADISILVIKARSASRTPDMLDRYNALLNTIGYYGGPSV
jgi:DUF917 family protein